MPKTTVRAAADGMPSINRRHAILGAGATMAALAALTRPAPAGASPLLDRSHRSWEPNSANLSINDPGKSELTAASLREGRASKFPQIAAPVTGNGGGPFYGCGSKVTPLEYAVLQPPRAYYPANRGISSWTGRGAKTLTARQPSIKGDGLAFPPELAPATVRPGGLFNGLKSAA